MIVNALRLVCVYFLLVLVSCSKGSSEPLKEEESDPLTTFFQGEVRPEMSKSCFNGAYYRKLVSSRDVWLGIGGKVVLPEMVFDPARANPAKPGQYLDNPSVYMGGSMGGQETDIGLTWEVIKDDNGNISADRRAFRPFLRRTSHPGGQAATYENAPALSQYYWYPGEEVNLTVMVIADKKIRFVVEGAGKRFERDFDCDGYRPGAIGEFKRVNAIDQVANEGKPVQATKTLVRNSTWKETHLYRKYQNEIVSVPGHSQRFTDMRCPATSYFQISRTDEEKKIGAEAITISGAGF